MGLGVRAGILVLLGCTARPFLAVPAVHAQADSSAAVPRDTAPPAGKPAAVGAATRALYGKHCAKCHDADGRGKAARGLFPEIPDFTKNSWQRGRRDAQLLVSLLDGKGTGMPSLNGKITRSEARDLVAYVRTFAPASKKASDEKQDKAASDAFERRYRSLLKELDDLQRQFHELSKTSAEGRSDKSSSRSTTSTPVTPAAADALTQDDLYRRYCAKCHGKDGTGSRVRQRQPEIPDFTDPQWQARHGDAQLLKSILDGKGKKMPDWRGKITRKEARILVEHIRTFVPPSKRPGKVKHEESRASGAAEAPSLDQYWNSTPKWNPCAQKSLWWNWKAGRGSPRPLPNRGSRGTCAGLTVVSISSPGRATWLQYRNWYPTSSRMWGVTQYARSMAISGT
jgi:mono/diheme cytochrome c family protein